MYDFGFDSFVRLVIGHGECPSEFHFACHFLSKAGRLSLRGIEVFVDRRIKVFAAREIARGLGRVHRREYATRGVNRRRDSACMMTIISSCLHQKPCTTRARTPGTERWCLNRSKTSPELARPVEPQDSIGFSATFSNNTNGRSLQQQFDYILKLVPCWNQNGIGCDVQFLTTSSDGIVYVTAGTSVQHARLYSL